eukprot:m.55116 g.55116  ORF g.55116 m.55116 type:complete len:459 (+) comp7741_c1_seq4:303-1679(+)
MPPLPRKRVVLRRGHITPIHSVSSSTTATSDSSHLSATILTMAPGNTSISTSQSKETATSVSSSSMSTASPSTSKSVTSTATNNLSDDASSSPSSSPTSEVLPTAVPTTCTLNNFLLQLLVASVSFGRMIIQILSIYLWNLDNDVVMAYVGFTSILCAKFIIWMALKPSWHTLFVEKRVDKDVVLRGIALLPIFLLYIKFIRTLSWGLEWPECLYCVYPFVFEMLYHQFGPKKESLNKMWAQAQYPHYKPKAMNSVAKHLLREGTVRIVESVWYMIVLPHFLVPGDHLIINWHHSILLMVCAAVDLVSLHLTLTYHWHWERLHKCACALGCWKSCTNTGGCKYTAGSAFKRGDIVILKKEVYKAIDHMNTADPSSKMSRVFWFLFRSPAETMGKIAFIQLWVIVVQIVAMLLSRHWLIISLWGGSQLISYVTIGHTLYLRHKMMVESIPLAGTSKKRK